MKTKLRILLSTGIILVLAPVWGFLGTVISMNIAKSHMEENGITMMELLADYIAIARYAVVTGLLICPIGIALIIISAIKLNRIKNEKSQPEVGAYA